MSEILIFTIVIFDSGGESAPPAKIPPRNIAHSVFRPTKYFNCATITFVVTLARILYEMFCRDYQVARNPDGSKKTIGTLRPEFITGSNAILSRDKDQLTLTWKDYYPEKQHQVLAALFDKLNEQSMQPIPFLGNLKLKFKMASPRSPDLYNQFRRGAFEF